MDFFNNWFFGKSIAVQLPFFEDGCYVWVFYLVTLGDALVTPAKGAQTLAKWQMNVQTNPFGSIAFGKTLEQGFAPSF